jgi:hypothetical protein
MMESPEARPSATKFPGVEVAEVAGLGETLAPGSLATGLLVEDPSIFFPLDEFFFFPGDLESLREGGQFFLLRGAGCCCGVSANFILYSSKISLMRARSSGLSST